MNLPHKARELRRLKEHHHQFRLQQLHRKPFPIAPYIANGGFISASHLHVPVRQKQGGKANRDRDCSLAVVAT